jgi:putative DNA primase/helicase
MTNLEDSVWKVPDVALLIIDPIVSAINGNGHNNVDVRKSLQPIVDFGQKVNCAILGITHFSKGTETRNPLERVTGSLAFGAVARVVIATAKIQVGDDIKRIVCRAKSNISEDSGGYEYEIRQERITNDIESSCVIWGPSVVGQAIDLFAHPSKKDRSDETALDSAKNFLKELLSDGSLPSKQIFSDAKEAGFSSSTLNRAKTELQIKARKSGVDNCWYWELQDIQPIQDTQPNKMSILTKLPIQESSQNSLRI